VADPIKAPYRTDPREIRQIVTRRLYASAERVAIITAPAEGWLAMKKITRLCVYCGSSGAVDMQYQEAASELGARLAAAGIELIYGGGRIGLMGLLADAVLAASGKVTGIIPTRLREAEVAHLGVSELVVVDSMHDRKRLMAEKADAFAVLPGGIGTLDEFFEIVSWKQLELHDKPVLLVDIGGYWAPLRALLDHLVVNGFARPQTRRLLHVVSSISALMATLSEEPAGLRKIDVEQF
jgi:uncharacterized protein (TIGR00730 family)